MVRLYALTFAYDIMFMSLVNSLLLGWARYLAALESKHILMDSNDSTHTT